HAGRQSETRQGGARRRAAIGELAQHAVGFVERDEHAGGASYATCPGGQSNSQPNCMPKPQSRRSPRRSEWPCSENTMSARRNETPARRPRPFRSPWSRMATVTGPAAVAGREATWTSSIRKSCSQASSSHGLATVPSALLRKLDRRRPSRLRRLSKL